MAILASSLSLVHLSTKKHINSLHFCGPIYNANSYPVNNYSKKPIIRVLAASAKKSKGSQDNDKGEEEEGPSKVPSWAKPGSDEPPPWARQELSAAQNDSSFQVPFIVYLLASAITAIAAIGSIFEYVNQKPVFGVLNSDSVFYAPVLGFFALTGIPTSGFLWYKSVQTANKDAEEQDRRDGYL